MHTYYVNLYYRIFTVWRAMEKRHYVFEYYRIHGHPDSGAIRSGDGNDGLERKVNSEFSILKIVRRV